MKGRTSKGGGDIEAHLIEDRHDEGNSSLIMRENERNAGSNDESFRSNKNNSFSFQSRTGSTSG